MSMNGLQHVVCRAAIDPGFLKLLAHSARDALYGFDIADDEVAMIDALRPGSLEELGRGVEAWRRGDHGHSRSVVREPAIAIVAG
jgi:hypothetical protein